MYKKLLTVLVVFVLGVFFFGAYRNNKFEIKGTDPSIKGVSTSAPYFKIFFSKPLGEDVKVSVYPQNTLSSVQIKDNTVTVFFDRTLSSSTEYSVVLKNISSKTGSTISDRSFSFTPKPMSVSSLPSNQRAAVKKKEGDYNKAVYEDGLVQLLPFQSGGNEFSIDYDLDYSKSPPGVIIKVSSSTETGKQDALNWIKSVGFDPDNYSIAFTDYSYGE